MAGETPADRFTTEKVVRRATGAKPGVENLRKQSGLASGTIRIRGKVSASGEKRRVLPCWNVHLNRLRTGRHHQARICGVFMLLLLSACGAANALPRTEPTVEELKARLSSTNIGDRPRLCIQIAEKQMDATNKLYAAAEIEKAQTALTDVVAYSELARDYAIQSHKYQKQSEIAVRGMSRKLTNLLHSLGRDDQAPVQDAVNRLERVRDDLLASMFKKVRHD